MIRTPRMRTGSLALVAVSLAVAACSSGASFVSLQTSGRSGTAVSAPVVPPAAASSEPRARTAASEPRARIAAAEAHARSSNKRVLVDFGADWCPDCRVLDQLYTDKAVAPILARDYILVHVDVGHFDTNMDLSAHYGNAASIGIPALVVLDATDRMFVSTSDGAFADARTMKPSQVAAFLTTWAPSR